MLKKVAVFDVDGTIFRSSLLIEIVETMIELGIFPVSIKSSYEKKRVAWLDRKGDYEEYVNAVVDGFMKHLKGVRYEDFNRAGEIVIARNANRLYRFTRDLVKELKRKKYFLLAISQSPKTVLEPFCKRLGFDKVYGRYYETGPTGIFTGEVAELHLISNKANIVRRAIEKEHLTLKGSYGVGDTEGDLSFLEMVDHPIAFNPNAGLYRHAKRQNWRIVVERKDVIYDLGNL